MTKTLGWKGVLLTLAAGATLFFGSCLSTALQRVAVSVVVDQVRTALGT